MFRPRIIPVLLLKDKGLVKSIGFKKYRYIGDPINAVKLFNVRDALDCGLTLEQINGINS